MGIFQSKHEANVICVGLDNSGKSTIINSLKPAKERVEEVAVTVGFSMQKFSTDKVNFTVFDMSGSGKYRNLWEHYYSDVQGIIFVVDSTDVVRMEVVKTELFTLLSHPDISGRPVPILFYSNKKDLPNSVEAAEISKILDLPRILDRPITIVASNALNGEGIQEGARWLSDRLLQK